MGRPKKNVNEEVLLTNEEQLDNQEDVTPVTENILENQSQVEEKIEEEPTTEPIIEEVKKENK